METSSCLGGRILAEYRLILVIRAVFGHFFEHRQSGRFTGVSGGDCWETGAELGLDWRWVRCSSISIVYVFCRMSLSFPSCTSIDSTIVYPLFFSPWANARAAARSFSSGFPLLIPPKSFRGPTVSHPLQQNSSTTTNPRLASFSFRAL